MTDYTELRKAAEAAQHDGDEDSCCVLGLMHDQIIALLDERDALREQVNALRDVMGTMCAKAIVLESYAENVTGFPMQQRLMGIAKDIDESARSAYEATEPKE